MHSMMQGMSAMLERMTKQEAGQEESAKKSSVEKLDGEIFEKVNKFTGGEEEWIEWSEDLRMMIDMKSPKLAKVMMHVENHGEKAVDKAVKDLVEEDGRNTSKTTPTWPGSLMSSTGGWYWSRKGRPSYSSKVVGTTMAQQRGAECMPSSRDVPSLG